MSRDGSLSGQQRVGQQQKQVAAGRRAKTESIQEGWCARGRAWQHEREAKAGHTAEWEGPQACIGQDAEQKRGWHALQCKAVFKVRTAPTDTPCTSALVCPPRRGRRERADAVCSDRDRGLMRDGPPGAGLGESNSTGDFMCAPHDRMLRCGTFCACFRISVRST